ncbi:MAG: 2Fe-2S iron-sulfur cluster-binding protein, partial [Kiritimatiellia bacterium]
MKELILREREYRIVFQPAGRHVFAIAGTVLLEAAARAGLVLRTPCGGGGTCGKCVVRVTQGDCPPTPACRAALGQAALSEGLRLACQARVHDDLVVAVPAAALFDPGQNILGSDSRDGLHLDPVVRALPVELPPPSHEDARADAERLRSVLPGSGFNAVALPLLRDLPQRLRSAHFRGTA